MENQTDKTLEQNNQKKHRDILKLCVLTLIILAGSLFIFKAGMIVGEMKAKFSYRWADNYHQNFGGPRDGFMGNWRKTPLLPGDFIESRGTFGEIIKISNSDIIVKGQNNMEKIVVITKGTVIEMGRNAIKKENLKIGDTVVIIGSPNEKGQIEAKLIRLFNNEDAPNLPGSNGLRGVFPNF